MKLLIAVGIFSLLSGLFVVILTYESNPSGFNSSLFDPLVLLSALGPVILGIVSFRLARVPLQRVHVRMMAVTFLIFSLSVPATFYYADQTAQIGCLCGNAGPRDLATITGSIIVPSSSGFGNLTITLWNSNGAPISQIRVTNASELPEAAFVVFHYHGSAIGISNPLPDGNRSTGSLEIGNVTAGLTYTIAIAMTYQNLGQGYQTLDITAQLS